MTKLLTPSLLLSVIIGMSAAADAPQIKPYPLDTCIVSGEKLGAMGKAVIITREGQEIKLCCKGCIKDFDKDPATFLAKIAAAEKAATDAKK